MKYILSGLLLVSSAYASEVALTEDMVTKLSLESNPNLNQIEATFLDSKVRAEEMADKFGFEAYGGYNNIQTKERATIPIIPVFKTINQYQVGVKKYTKYGVVLDVNTSVDNRSGDSSITTFKDVVTTKYEFGVQMDLWRDFMGRMTRSQFDNLQDLKKKDELQAEISKSAFLTNTRKLYWNLVANQEKLEITERLAQKANAQAEDARRRRRDSVADRAEVARFESLVHQRKGALIKLRYEREMLLKSLRETFPELNGKEVKLAKYNPDKTLFDILACTSKINEEADVPFNSTSYDEVISLLRNVQKRQGKIDNTYDDIDVKFDLKLRQVGVASDSDDNGSTYEGSYSESIDDINDNDRSGMEAGIMVSIPFGEDRAKTRSVKEAYTERSFSANIDAMESKVRSTHQQTKQTVKLLSELMKEQRANSKQLAIRVSEMKKKYAQARIPEYALIQDEDSLLQSDLGVVDIQLMVVETMLDYFGVFHNYPCAFNRVAK